MQFWSILIFNQSITTQQNDNWIPFRFSASNSLTTSTDTPYPADASIDLFWDLKGEKTFIWSQTNIEQNFYGVLPSQFSCISPITFLTFCWKCLAEYQT